MGMKFNGIWMGPPLILDVYGRSTGKLKPEQDWNKLSW